MRFSELLDGDYPDDVRRSLLSRVMKMVKNSKLTINVKMQYDWDSAEPFKNKTIPRISFEWDINPAYFKIYDIFTIEEQRKFSAFLKPIFKQAEAEFRKNTAGLDLEKNRFEIDIDSTIRFAVKITDGFKDGLNDIGKLIKPWIRARYKYLTSKESVDKINALNSEQERRDAMKKYGKDVIQVLELLKHFY